MSVDAAPWSVRRASSETAVFPDSKGTLNSTTRVRLYRLARLRATRPSTSFAFWPAALPVWSARSTVPVVWVSCLACSVNCRRSEEHTSELQSLAYLVCRLLLEKKKHVLYMIQGDCRTAEPDSHRAMRT